ncbi:phage repressor protein, partial [Staphylococcus aureus]
MPLIKSGQLCTIDPVDEHTQVNVGDIVLCKVHGRQYLHKVKAVKGDSFQIANNKGFINGWANRKSVYGKLVRVED